MKASVTARVDDEMYLSIRGLKLMRGCTESDVVREALAIGLKKMVKRGRRGK